MLVVCGARANVQQQCDKSSAQLAQLHARPPNPPLASAMPSAMTAAQLTTCCWLLLLAVLLQQALRSDAFSLCKTSAKTDNCAHGLTRDYCGNIVCAKGPGERCGGPSNVLGQCGEGMHCKCEVCNGCSVETVECHVAEPTCY